MPNPKFALVIVAATAAGAVTAASAASMGRLGTADVGSTARTAAIDLSAGRPTLASLGQPPDLPVLPSPSTLGLPLPSLLGGFPLVGSYLVGSSGFDPNPFVTFLPGYIVSIITNTGLPDPAAVIATVPDPASFVNATATDPAAPLTTLSSIVEASRLPVAGGLIGQAGGLAGPILTTAGTVEAPLSQAIPRPGLFEARIHVAGTSVTIVSSSGQLALTADGSTH